jgi:CMP-N-acetylneuraminic acid synthetase
MTKILGIIPARGGSKGIRKKNIQPLGPKPLLAYTIEAARKSLIDRVLVSTDDDEIAAIAKQHGAEVPFIRPAELATDEASSLSVLLHALHFCEAHGDKVEVVAFLQPTSPFRTSRQIDACIHLLRDSEVDSVVTVQEVTQHPYFVYAMQSDGRLREIMPMKPKPLRRQDLPIWYSIADGLIASRRRYFEQIAPDSPVFNPQSMKGYVVDAISALSIDSPIDLAWAEFFLTSQRNNGESK